MRLTPPLNLPAPGRRQCLYVVLLDFADTCVFAKQSLGPILCGLLPLPFVSNGRVPEAPLLPKLRGHFAEFLLRNSLEHLRLLASPTCVRFRYGQSMHSPPRLFSAACLGPLESPEGNPRTPLSTPPAFSLRGASTTLDRDDQSPGWTCAPASPLWVITHMNWFRTIHLIPIVYALRPRLRSRLTRSG